jgi:hypothetical protein
MAREGLGVERDRVQVNTVPVSLDPQPKPGGAAAASDAHDNLGGDLDDDEPTRVRLRCRR